MHSIDKTRYDLHTEIMETKGDIRGYEIVSLTYISYIENILLLIQAIFDVKSVMYHQTTTIRHVNFYTPNTALQQAGRLFYAGH